MTSNLKQNSPRNSQNPEPETRGISFSFPDPQGMKKCHSPISRNPRGMKIARELASLSRLDFKSTATSMESVHNWHCLQLQSSSHQRIINQIITKPKSQLDHFE